MSAENAESTPDNDTRTAECRTCLQKLDTEQLSNLFQAWTTSWEGMKSTIAEDLSVLANIQLKETDKHSKLICSSCCSNLWNACKFKLLVQANDKILRQRYPETDTQVPTEKEWPQPIQVEKSITGLYNNPSQVEIKQEVLTDDENENMGNGEDGYTTTNCVDMIKIEPEEIAQPVISVPPSFRVTEINGQECLEEEDETPTDSEMDQPIQDRARGSDATKQDTGNVTKQTALLTHADVMEAVAEALSKPVEVCKEVQVTTPELDTGAQADLTVSPKSSAALKDTLPGNTKGNIGSSNSIFEPTKNDEQLQNASEKAIDECAVTQKVPNKPDSVLEGEVSVDGENIEVADNLKPHTGCEAGEETTSISDFTMEIEPTSPYTGFDVEKFYFNRTRSTETIYVEAPPTSSDTPGVLRIVPIAKRIEVPMFNDKDSRRTSKQVTTKTKSTNLNENIEPETLVNKDASLFKNLAMSSNNLNETTVPKPASVTPEPEKVLTNMTNTNKELSQKLDGLSETVATVLDNQKVLTDTQDKILALVMGLSSQFEQFMKNSQNETSPNIRTSSRLDPFMERCPSYLAAPVPVPEKHFFKPIDSSKALQALEESLKDETFANELKCKFLAICGIGNGKTGSNCYLLLDLMFDRKFLTQCSWSGGSRDESIKVCFRFFKNVIHFFFSVIYATDQTYSLLECEEFLKKILRNSMKRQAAKMMRASTSRCRKRRRNKSDSDNDTPQQEIDETMFIKSLMAASGYETYLQTVKEEPLSEPEDSEVADLPMDCLLCARTFISVSGLKAHVIAQHSYQTVERKPGNTSPHRTQHNNKYVCATCRRTFVTSTDLMVHETCHNKHICYGCSAKFDTFDQLTKHRRRCKALSSPNVKPLKTLEDVKRPPQETQLVTEIKIEINNVTTLADSNETFNCPQCNEVFSDPYYMKIHQEVHHAKEEALDMKNGPVPMEIEALESIFTEET